MKSDHRAIVSRVKIHSGLRREAQATRWRRKPSTMVWRRWAKAEVQNMLPLQPAQKFSLARAPLGHRLGAAASEERDQEERL